MLHRLALVAVLSLLSTNAGVSYAADYKAEYEKKIKASQDVGVLGDGLAGDQVNFYTGATSFSATDLSIPGNSGLPVAVSRSYDVEFAHQRAVAKGNATNKEIISPVQRAFGDWDLDVPYIGTTMTHDGGWVISTTEAPPLPNRRCEVLGQTMNTYSAQGVPATGAPPDAVKQLPAGGGYVFPASDYWHGYDLHVGGKSQSLLLASLPNSQRPTDGKTYHWTTNQNWWVSCLQASASAGGQGFLAVSPDGTRYTFNHLSKRKVDDFTYLDQINQQLKTYYLFRAEYQMLPTRIEDRFGNWVEYSWLGGEYAKLDIIKSSDGRAIQFAYNGNGHVSTVTEATVAGSTVTLGTRVWTYIYTAYTGEGVTAHSLSQVTLPDGSTWKYNLSALNHISASNPHCAMPLEPPQVDWACFGGGVKTSTPKYGDITHPSGAKVEFTFDQHFQIGDLTANSMSAFGWPLGIVSKRITGGGLTPATWQYAFAPSREQSAAACQAGACPTRIVTDQIDPDGSISRRIFGVVSLQDQSMLLGELEGKLDSSLAAGGSQPITCSLRWGCDLLDDPTPGGSAVPVFYREQDFQYVPYSQATPYVLRVGVNPLGSIAGIGATTYASEHRLPIQRKTTTQQGVNFTWQVDTHSSCSNLPCYDVYGNPTRVTRFSAGNAGGDSTRTEVTAYAHDTTKWAIGEPASLTDVATNKIISRTTYDSNLLPWKIYRFEVLDKTFTYNPDATLATVSDGLNNTIQLGNTKRRIPQSIAHPNGFIQSAIVNDSGWITSATDHRGGANATTTNYGYDASGKLALIDYTNADSVPWNDTTLAFVQVSTPEFGLPGAPEKHWRQIVQTGNGRTTIYYDSRWRPVLTVSEDLSNAASRSFVLKRFDNQNREIFSSYPVSNVYSVADDLDGVFTTYDALGRMIKTERDAEAPLNVLTNTTEYLTGFVSRSTNPRGVVSEIRYKVFDTPSTEAPVEIVAAKLRPEQQITTIARQPSLGKTTSVTRSGTFAGSALQATRSYVYDPSERLCKSVNPESGVTVFEYDAAGNIAWDAKGTIYTGLSEQSCVVDRQHIINNNVPRAVRTYDAMNNQVHVATPGGLSDITTTYELDGLVKTTLAINPNGGQLTNSYSYFNRRLLRQETQNDRGYYNHVSSYGYNANGHIESLTYPDFTTVNYAPDALGRATMVSSPGGAVYARNIQYHPNGAISRFAYGNDIVHAMTRNVRGLPMHSIDEHPLTHVKALDDTYSFDANGNVTDISDLAQAGLTTRGMGYDGLDRLTAAISPSQWGTATFAYDPLDNLREANQGARQYRYIYDSANRLQQINNPAGALQIALTYNADGTTASRTGQTYSFDFLERLAGVSGKEYYNYEANGRRSQSWKPDYTNVYWHYSQSGQLLYASDSELRRNIIYIYLGNTQVATRSVNWDTYAVSIDYQHTDSLGSPVAESSVSGVVTKRVSYAPFGETFGTTSTNTTGYTGHVMDQRTGLTYMQQRYYDPQIGRFLSVDPMPSDVTTGWNFNRLNYAANNPYRFTDPDGRVVDDTSRPLNGLQDPMDPCTWHVCFEGDDKASADSLRTKYGKGTKGKGHHWVPFASTTGENISEEARKVFGQSVSGQSIPNGIHCKGHCDYNKAVKTELTNWARLNRIDLTKMTAAQARSFVSHIRTGTNVPTINVFVRKIDEYNDLVRRWKSPFVVKILYGTPMVSIASQAWSTNSYPCVLSEESGENACGR